MTRSSALRFLTGITVVPITTTIRGIPPEVLLTPEADGVFVECVVNTDNLQTVQKANLVEFITELSPDRMREVRSAIEFSLGFDALL